MMDVDMTYVPQIKGHRVNRILEEARKYVDVDKYIPDMKDDKLPSRHYIINFGKETMQITSKLIRWYLSNSNQ